jgi:dolichyl-phosphate-mannose-protein mannosyltransferase
MQEEAPEPIHNVFEEVNPPSEEKTIDPVGPKNEVQMAESTAIPDHQRNFEAGLEAEKPEDTRAPVGLDAGAPAVTAEAEDDGWHGGAEDDGKRQVDKEREKEKVPGKRHLTREL